MTLKLLRLSIATAVVTVSMVTASHALTCEILLAEIRTPLVPKTLKAGDRLFDGHGPEIWAATQLRIADGGRKILADVNFRARETGADGSETAEKFSNLVVWQAPQGQFARKILTPAMSSVHYISKPASSEKGGVSGKLAELREKISKAGRKLAADAFEDFESGCRKAGIKNSETCVNLFNAGLSAIGPESQADARLPESGGPVAAFYITGDVGGETISIDGDPKRKSTRIDAITFKKIQVDLSGVGACPGSDQSAVSAGQTNATKPTPTTAGAAAPVPVAPTIVVHQTPMQVMPVQSGLCARTLQGNIAWDGKGNKQWSSDQIASVCKPTPNSDQPARCFDRIMRGEVNWGGGTQWVPKNAIDLCRGSRDASATLGCFNGQIKAAKPWTEAIRSCNG